MSQRNAVPPADTTTVFDRLDRDWTITCRRHRRAETLAEWCAVEPALADVDQLDDLAAPGRPVPAEHFAAVLRLTRTGDTVAARALLQMIRPGLVRIVRDLRSPRHPNMAAEVVTAAWAYIHRLQAGVVTVHTAVCLLRSIRRDVLRARPTPDVAIPIADPTGAAAAWPPRGSDTDSNGTVLSMSERMVPPVPPAETTALAEPMARAVLDSAVADAIVTPAAAQFLWLTAVDQQSVPDVAAAAGIAVSTAYALRAGALRQLRDYIDTA